MQRQRLLSIAIYGLTSVIGGLAFIYPFLLPSIEAVGMGQAHSNDAPLLLTALVSLCFVALLFETQGQALGAKLIALLGVLVAINSVLRFVETAVPGPGGYSPIFFLIILVGYVYGGRMGFLMGALTLIVSALITGTVGPWLPYQMFTAGWIGLSAPLCHPVVRLFDGEGRRAEIVTLAIFAALWGLVYGAIMNLWFWPFFTSDPGQSWTPGIGIVEGVQRYATFYLVTSLQWDFMRSAGNVLLMLAVGAPAIRALRRFRRRFDFAYRPAPEPMPTGVVPDVAAGPRRAQ